MSEAIKKILDYWYTIELLKQDSFDKKTGEIVERLEFEKNKHKDG